MTKNIILLKRLKFSYKKKQILDIDELNIKRGEKVFLHGPSGSGKSTLLNIIAGILKPDDGHVIIEDTDLTRLSSSKKDVFRGDNIGFIFQTFNLIPYLSIRENIILPLINSKRRKQNVSHINDEILRISKVLQIDKFLNKKVTDLSVGQQQRVAVARALIGKPKLIIADEPTSSLDNMVTKDFINYLLEEQEREKFSLLFVSHDKSLSTFFDREISLVKINKEGEE